MQCPLAPILAVALVGAAVPGVASTPEARCGGLAKIFLRQAKVKSTEMVSAGAFTPPAALSPWLRGDLSLYKNMPAFCRVVVEATPSADSAIEIETWLPASGWNGKFRGQGNGGFAGEINFGAMAAAVLQGYATAGTNTGHSGAGTDASWALGHPEKVTDFGYRAIHTMTEVAKTAIRGFYGSAPRYSYFASCSNGGRQALMEAQRYPEDYDGVIAGAPAYAWTRLLTKALADARATTLDPASYIPKTKLKAIAKSVNAACDARDGVTDGIVGDQPGCRFDPATMACREGDSEACLTGPQVRALQALYAGPRDSRGRLIFPGYLPGAEEGNGGWSPWITGDAPGQSLMFAFGLGYFTNMVYEKPGWDYRTADVEEALAAAVEKTGQKLDATDTNLAPFKARGGKLILYHGWNDPGISALSTLEYFDGLVSRMGRAETDGFVRLYMIPGMQHCAGGPAPDSFGQEGMATGGPGESVLAALEQWVEDGTAPAAIVASKYANHERSGDVLSTRPICPHPQTAKYKGQGKPSEASSFVCALPTP